MKRDDELIRRILLDAERQDDYLILVVRTMSGGDRQREHHVDLLCDAGFLVAVGKATFRLTNSGHDYLAAVRNDNIWQKTKDGAASVGGVTLGIMKDIAVSYLKQQASEKLGMTL